MFKVAIIGLDTSHSVELPKLMQDPTVKPEHRVEGLIATRCLRFETPFQLKDGLDARQKYLESIGVMVTEDFDTAVADCDGIMIEINDPDVHLEYFEKCAKLGKPIYLDKPFADTIQNARRIAGIAKENNVRFFTASCLRFMPELDEALADFSSTPRKLNCWGPLGQAPTGCHVVWYGCHIMEVCQRIMGKGAVMVNTVKDRNGSVSMIHYDDGRRCIMELTWGCYRYGGVIRDDAGKETFFAFQNRVPLYKSLMDEVRDFFINDKMPVTVEDSLEVMAVLDAAARSYDSGKPEPVYYS